MNAFEYYRKKARLSQQEVANEIGATQQAVAKWENEQAFPRTDKLRALAKLYGCTIDDLFTTAEEA